MLVNGIFILAILLSVFGNKQSAGPTGLNKRLQFLHFWLHMVHQFLLPLHQWNNSIQFLFYSGHHLTISTVAPAGIEISADWCWWDNHTSSYHLETSQLALHQTMIHPHLLYRKCWHLLAQTSRVQEKLQRFPQLFHLYLCFKCLFHR